MPPGSNPIPNHVLNRRRNDVPAAQTVRGDDPAVATLANFVTPPQDEAELLEMESNTVASFPNYCKKVTEMIKWWKEHYREADDVLVFELSDAERNDKRLHYFGATHDLRYDLLEPRWMQIFYFLKIFGHINLMARCNKISSSNVQECCNIFCWCERIRWQMKLLTKLICNK
jgi:hypothetical protein